MDKIWEIKDSKANRIIFIYKDCIYKGNPKQRDRYLLDKDVSDLKAFFSIPYAYIRKIECPSKGHSITIHYGTDSEDELVIKDKGKKAEVFEYFKAHIPKFQYTTVMPSLFQYAKGQLFAMLILTVLFIRTVYLANEIESGIVYELVGSAKSIAAVSLALANIGTVKLISGYVLLISLLSFRLSRKSKSMSETEQLIRVK